MYGCMGMRLRRCVRSEQASYARPISSRIDCELLGVSVSYGEEEEEEEEEGEGESVNAAA